MIGRIGLIDALKVLLPLLALAGGVYWVYSSGQSQGKAEIQKLWDDAKLEEAAEVARLEKEIADTEQVHRQESRKVADKLADSEIRFAGAIAALRGDFAQRLQQHSERATVYERLSDGGTAERSHLASHAAELDRSLEEGRLLVGELRSTLEQRDQQILGLADQIRADRQLIGGASE
jgi:hypothetical protein